MEEKKHQQRVQKLKPLKDVNSADRTLLIKNMVWSITPLSVLGYLYGGVKGLVLGIAGGIGVGFLTVFLSGRLSGGAINTFYGMRRGRWTSQELVEGDMNIARKFKREKQYHQARLTVDQILQQTPDNTEALFLKAQILWEGFQAQEAAKGCLQTIMRLQPDAEATIHRWAASLVEEIDRAVQDHPHEARP
jgi:hypothetical protein